MTERTNIAIPSSRRRAPHFGEGSTSPRSTSQAITHFSACVSRPDSPTRRGRSPRIRTDKDVVSVAGWCIDATRIAHVRRLTGQLRSIQDTAEPSALDLFRTSRPDSAEARRDMSVVVDGRANEGWSKFTEPCRTSRTGSTCASSLAPSRHHWCRLERFEVGSRKLGKHGRAERGPKKGTGHRPTPQAGKKEDGATR